MTEMRAAVFTAETPSLRIESVERPSPGPGEAILRVRACGICGSDLHATEVEGMVQPGSIIGHEIAGEIVELGPDPVGEWPVGERAFALPFLSCGRCETCLAGRSHLCPNAPGLGGIRPGQLPGACAEYVMVTTSDLVRLPSHVSWEVGSLVEPLAVALACLRLAELPLAARVLVMGGGPIGLAIAHLARFVGCRSVVVSEPMERRRALAMELGATDVIDPTAGDVGGTFMALTGGEPDVVFEAIGRPGMLNAAVQLVRVQGTVVSAGQCRVPDPFDHVSAYYREPTIKIPAFYTLDDCRFIVEMLDQGRLDPSALVTHRVELDELPAAFDALRTPTDQIKVVVQP